MKRTCLPTVFALVLAACSQQSAAEPTAPAEPASPVEPAAPAEPPAEPAEPAEADEAPSPAAPVEPAEDTTAAAEETTPAEAPKPAPKPKAEPTKPAPKTEAKAKPEAKPEPEPEAKPEPKAEAPKPAGSTRIPQSDHVRVEVPAKLQALLDGDSRMQGWITQVMRVAEQCYAQVRGQSPQAGGTIVVNVTMHENSRPSPDIKNLPPALSNLVACATGRLFNVRMPLFTGPEGQKHQVKLIFKP